MKKLNDFQNIGFTVESKYQVAYGLVGGMKFVVHFIPNQRCYYMTTSVKGENDEAFIQGLKRIEEQQYVSSVSYQQRNLMVYMTNKRGLSIENFEMVMRDIVTICQTYQYVQCCRHCGSEENVGIYRINGQVDMICAECVQKIEASIETPKQSNMPLGIVGAFIGSLIGVAAWILIYKLGFVAGITGFVMAFCCIKGYELLGKSIDKKGAIIAVVIAVLMLFVGEMGALALEIYDAFKDYYVINLWDAITSIPYFLEDSEVMGAVVEDLLFGYAFMAAASFSYIISVFRQINDQGVITKLD